MYGDQVNASEEEEGPNKPQSPYQYNVLSRAYKSLIQERPKEPSEKNHLVSDDASREPKKFRVHGKQLLAFQDNLYRFSHYSFNQSTTIYKCDTKGCDGSYQIDSDGETELRRPCNHPPELAFNRWMRGYLDGDPTCINFPVGQCAGWDAERKDFSRIDAALAMPTSSLAVLGLQRARREFNNFAHLSYGSDSDDCLAAKRARRIAKEEAMGYQQNYPAFSPDDQIVFQSRYSGLTRKKRTEMRNERKRKIATKQQEKEEEEQKSTVDKAEE